jgi:LytS/YehU family sensor histidine kinase
LENVKLYAANLEQDNIQAKYQALKHQVDPHFFFNSLSVLSSIVHTNPEMAGNYIHNLSKLYRYTLETKQNNVVPLTDELEFLDSYLFLMKIRYPYSLNFKIELDRLKTDRVGIHANCLQLLIENAIKHNTFKDDDPLTIEIAEDDGYICVQNRIRKKKQPNPSTGIGLENIRRRYELCDEKKIIVRETDGNFIVKLPKIEFIRNEDRYR